MPELPVETKKAAPAPMPDPFRSLRSEMEHLFDRFAAGFRPTRRGMSDTEPTRRYESSFYFPTPTAEIAEDDKMVKITVELPGLAQKNIQVTVSGDLLTLKGEKRYETDEKDRHVRARLRLLPTLFHAAADDRP